MGQFGGFTVRTSGAHNVQGGSFLEMGLCIREVRFDPDSVAKVVLPKVPKILRATGAAFV
jgi:hypothetical protein